MQHNTQSQKRTGAKVGARTAPQNGLFGAVRKTFAKWSAFLRRARGDRLSFSPEKEPEMTRGVRWQSFLRTALSALAMLVVGLLLSMATLGFQGHPLGIALVSAVGISIPFAWMGAALGCLYIGAESGLYFSALVLCVGLRYVIGRFFLADEDAPHKAKALSASDGGGSDAWLRRALFPSGALDIPLSARVGVALISSIPPAVGMLIGGDGTVRMTLSALSVLCMAPLFSFLFCGVLGGKGIRRTPALYEGGVCALCFALTLGIGSYTVFGFSVRLIFAQLVTVYISKTGGFLRGGLAGLCAGLACDALYAPGFALFGAVSGLLWSVHLAPAILLSLLMEVAYAIYVGAFSAIRSVVPELIAAVAIAYPVLRYVRLPSFLKSGASTGGGALCALKDTASEAQLLGIPSVYEQLDALSGILSGLSATFYNLSDRTKKPSLSEIRALCEDIRGHYCGACALSHICKKEDQVATEEAMAKITLCVHRKGRVEMGAALAPLDSRCPSLPRMLSEINIASAALCEEKLAHDKTEVAAADYEGMAALLRASAVESAHAYEEDPMLSRRLARAMERIGFRAEHIAVYGKRCRTVVASGVDLGFASSAMQHAVGESGICPGSAMTGTSLLGTEDLRCAFSALAGVHYQSPDYALTDGGRNLVMTLRAQPKIAISCGTWGEKKAGEEMSGDVLSVFANRSDYFYALLCDGMGSGKEASVTAQIAALFLEKLLSVSAAKGATLSLLNGFLRARDGECSVSIDLCELDMITGEAHFVKCGAAATYLLRGESLFRIASNTMPLGILKEVSAEETTFTLVGGDTLLFFSDGVCDESEDSTWLIEQTQKALAKSRLEVKLEDEPSALSVLDRTAAMIGNAAKAKRGRVDDMTVAVIQIEDVA